MGTAAITVISAGITGSLVAVIGAVLRLHARFIKMELKIESFGEDMRMMSRIVASLLPDGGMSIRQREDTSHSQRGGDR